MAAPPNYFININRYRYWCFLSHLTRFTLSRHIKGCSKPWVTRFSAKSKKARFTPARCQSQRVFWPEAPVLLRAQCSLGEMVPKALDHLVLQVIDILNEWVAPTKSPKIEPAVCLSLPIFNMHHLFKLNMQCLNIWIEYSGITRTCIRHTRIQHAAQQRSK